MIIPVLGCGPAGLLVAHAVRLAGHQPVLYSRRVPSRLHGAQYLHKAIPGLPADLTSQNLYYERLGTEDGYRQKIYGDRDVKTSWSQFPDMVKGYNLGEAYEWLWSEFYNSIVDVQVDSHDVWGMDTPVFSTIPRQVLYADPSEYEWETEQVYVQPLEIKPYDGPGYICYNGFEDQSWYRMSVIFGHGSLEYPSAVKLPPGAHTTRVAKPVSTTAPEIPGVTMLGRYGKWQKGVLVDHAFSEAMKVLQAL